MSTPESVTTTSLAMPAAPTPTTSGFVIDLVDSTAEDVSDMDHDSLEDTVGSVGSHEVEAFDESSFIASQVALIERRSRISDPPAIIAQPLAQNEFGPDGEAACAAISTVFCMVLQPDYLLQTENWEQVNALGAQCWKRWYERPGHDPKQTYCEPYELMTTNAEIRKELSKAHCEPAIVQGYVIDAMNEQNPEVMLKLQQALEGNIQPGSSAVLTHGGYTRSIARETNGTVWWLYDSHTLSYDEFDRSRGHLLRFGHGVHQLMEYLHVACFDTSRLQEELTPSIHENIGALHRYVYSLTVFNKRVGSGAGQEAGSAATLLYHPSMRGPVESTAAAADSTPSPCSIPSQPHAMARVRVVANPSESILSHSWSASAPQRVLGASGRGAATSSHSASSNGAIGASSNAPAYMPASRTTSTVVIHPSSERLVHSRPTAGYRGSYSSASAGSVAATATNTTTMRRRPNVGSRFKPL